MISVVDFLLARVTLYGRYCLVLQHPSPSLVGTNFAMNLGRVNALVVSKQKPSCKWRLLFLPMGGRIAKRLQIAW